MSNRKVRFRPGHKTRYRMNNKSFGEFIMSEQALKPTMQVAKAVQKRAETIAPRSGDGKRTPYADQFDLRVRPEGLVAGKYRNRRVVVELINRADHAPSVEFGNRGTEEGERRGHRTMLRAGTMYGDSGIMVSTSGLRGWGS